MEVHPHWRNDNLIAHAKQHNIAVMVRALAGVLLSDPLNSVSSGALQAYAPMSSPGTMGKQGRKVPNLLEVSPWEPRSLISHESLHLD